jgi:hypothetical protein
MTCQGGKVSGGYYLYPSQKELTKSAQAMTEIFGITKWNKLNQKSKDFYIQMYASAKYGPSAGRQQAYENLQKGIEMAQGAGASLVSAVGSAASATASALQKAGTSIKNTYNTAVENNTYKNTLNGIQTFCNAAESAKKKFSPYGSPTKIQTEFYNEMNNFMLKSRFCGATGEEFNEVAEQQLIGDENLPQLLGDEESLPQILDSQNQDMVVYRRPPPPPPTGPIPAYAFRGSGKRRSKRRSALKRRRSRQRSSRRSRR